MKKLPSTAAFLLTFYVLPLADRTGLLLTWPVLLQAAFCTMLFLTQPALSVQESKEHKDTDGWTIWLIIGVSGAGQILSLVDWAYRQGAPYMLDAWTGSGILLLTFGTAFRLWAINTLKNNFAATVQIKQGQQLITSGPYRWLRHPSYTGAWIAMIGAALLMHSYLGLVLMGPGMLLVYMQRIAVEERTLEQAFGQAYTNMKMNTQRLVPGVW
ncbi:MAG TPA: isoprenylcysteine carboxylmethyltransferase family protein [Flavobacteriales bacterium]|nr:isoprenylcysteine carboxylmethyltransferase family protein [Flavobacteriales bacterium]HOZ40850.1 isoprenylcysteine carboxylmethyltransferase family protein [Flavobacteriales bacterium]